MMDDYNSLKRKPYINKEELKNRVMQSIVESDQRKIRRNKLIWKMAAAILLFISVGTYVWLEVNTYNSFLAMSQTNRHVSSRVNENEKCMSQIKHMVAVLKSAGFNVDEKKQTIQFSQAEVEELRQTESIFISDVASFIATFEELYPYQAQKYYSGEMIQLNAWHLRKDKNDCNWIK